MFIGFFFITTLPPEFRFDYYTKQKTTFGVLKYDTRQIRMRPPIQGPVSRTCYSERIRLLFLLIGN
jgi:hypothetical protein